MGEEIYQAVIPLMKSQKRADGTTVVKVMTSLFHTSDSFQTWFAEEESELWRGLTNSPLIVQARENRANTCI